MDMKSGALCAAKQLDGIVLRPRISLGLGIHNAKSGYSSGEHSLTFSHATTLLRVLAFFLMLATLCRILVGMRRRKMEAKWKEKYKNRWKRARRKMSKS